MKDKVATVIVDLIPDEEEIMNRLQKDARWGLKRAQREGLVVEESNEWDIFYKIYQDHMKEIGVKAESLEHVKEHGHVLLICKKDSTIIGGAALEVVQGVPTLTRAASKVEFRQFQPNNILYWHCILWSKNKGYKTLDLGGWQINAQGNLKGVNEFKERWGEVQYHEKEFPLFKALGRKLIRNSRLFWRINEKIKKRKH
ncbi:MAG: GNAT family N-acetyltransferase [Nanoarchaeota archaeon]|nr:GNAT family N-acetyltransferase [Nanoarchaeota archaeon]